MSRIIELQNLVTLYTEACKVKDDRITRGQLTRYKNLLDEAEKNERSDEQ